MLKNPSDMHDSGTEARAIPGLLSPKRWINASLDLIFPPRCAGCGRVDTGWCDRCLADLERVPLLLLPDVVEPPMAGLAATGLHAGRLQQAVHALKYEGVTSLADVLGIRLAARLKSLYWTFDTIVPVPLHRTRRRERGYNQAQLLAEVIAAHVMIPSTPLALERLRDTRPQVGLSRTQRQENTDEAFRGDPALLRGRAIVLIDDVSTTGSTLFACALAAQNAGATAIYGLTVTVAI